MSVLIVFENTVAEGGAEGFRFSPSCADGDRFTEATGSGIAFPADVPVTCSPLMAFLAATIFPGIHQSSGWDQSWPQGYLTALGLGLQPNPAVTWASLALSHLRHNRDQLVFIHETSPWITGSGVMDLIAALCTPFAELGWEIHLSPGGGPILLSSPMACRAVAAAYETIQGHSLQHVLPQGEGAGMLLQLLTTGQLVLAREQANRRREAEGLLALNTPWIYGIGCGTDFFGQVDLPVAVRGRYWCENLEFSGLARQAGWTPLDWETRKDNTVVDETKKLAHLADLVADAAASGPVWVQFSVATGQRLHQLGIDFINPLIAPLAAAKAGLLILTRETFGVDGTGYSWGYGRGERLMSKRRFWHRHRWAQGKGLTIDLARSLWLS